MLAHTVHPDPVPAHPMVPSPAQGHLARNRGGRGWREGDEETANRHEQTGTCTRTGKSRPAR